MWIGCDEKGGVNTNNVENIWTAERTESSQYYGGRFKDDEAEKIPCIWISFVSGKQLNWDFKTVEERDLMHDVIMDKLIRGQK